MNTLNITTPIRALKKFYLLFLIVFFTLLNSAYLMAGDESLERALIESLAKKDYKSAESLLKRGADPEATLGSQLKDNAVCTAIDDRSSKYLELLVQYGASPNAFWIDVKNSLHKTPLSCSVYLYNLEAFEFLLENGAVPSTDLNPESIEKYRNWTTAFTTALNSKIYPMALRLVDLYPLHPAELDRLVYELENRSYDEAHPWNAARNELIAWTKKRVPTLNPKPVHPKNGTEIDCLFHFRDHEEGLKKGTICHETTGK